MCKSTRWCMVPLIVVVVLSSIIYSTTMSSFNIPLTLGCKPLWFWRFPQHPRYLHDSHCKRWLASCAWCPSWRRIDTTLGFSSVKSTWSRATRRPRKQTTPVQETSLLRHTYVIVRRWNVGSIQGECQDIGAIPYSKLAPPFLPGFLPPTDDPLYVDRMIYDDLAI